MCNSFIKYLHFSIFMSGMFMVLSKQLPGGRLPILSFADNRSAAVSLPPPRDLHAILLH